VEIGSPPQPVVVVLDTVRNSESVNEPCSISEMLLKCSSIAAQTTNLLAVRDPTNSGSMPNVPQLPLLAELLGAKPILFITQH
jgi:hypothetical protein